MWRGLLTALLFLHPPTGGVQVPEVATVYPSGPSISSHTLRLSIRFVAPVMEEVLPRLHLLNGEGVELEHVFLAQELWSPDRRELTVLFDPGRLKSGVGRHDTQGLPLAGASRVRLMLDAKPIRQWTVSTEPCHPISPAQWTRVIPAAGSRDPLQVTFAEAVDHAAADRLAVVDAAGRRLQGKSQLRKQETAWQFTPSHAWVAGSFAVYLHPAFETPCGDRYQDSFQQSLAGRPAPDQAAPAFRFSIQ